MDPKIPNTISKERAFDLMVVFKQIYFSCITGSVGLIYGLIVILVYTKHVDRTFYLQLLGWTLFGVFNISWRFYLFIKWRKQPDLDLFDVQRRRWQAALLAGALWGTAGFLFFDNLNATGQSLLLLAFVIMDFTGIPTLYASTLGFSLLWGATWLPLLFFAHQGSSPVIFFVYSGVVLFSGLFISYALRKAIKDLFFANEAYSEKVVSLDKDNEQLKMFFLAANHDLSQPISAIQHAIYTLAKRVKDPDLVSAPLEIMRTSTASLTRLIEDIIHFERITSGLSKADMASVDLNDVFKRVIARCEHLSKAKDIGLWSRPTHRWVRTDAYILERILVNLVENALRYTVHGSVILAARPSGEHVSIEVLDSGLGMLQEDMDHIFEVFYRRDATKDMHKGYGLGLSIVKRLSESIGGVIRVRSQLGKGSVFKLRLPASEAERSTNSVQLPHSTAGSGYSIAGMKIAVLDDDQVLLSSISQVLQAESALVTGATTQKELASLIAADPHGYHVIVTDWNLRTSTGEDAFTELKNIHGFDPAWIVMSGDMDAGKEAELIARGIPVIRKPFLPDMLIRQLSKVRA